MDVQGFSGKCTESVRKGLNSFVIHSPLELEIVSKIKIGHNG